MRSILTVIGLVVGVAVALVFVVAIRRTLVQLVVAVFIAAILNPAVEFFERRRLRRGPATAVVMILALVVVAALAYLFVAPLYSGARHLANDLPGVVARTEAGQGNVGRLVRHFHLQKQVHDLVPKVRQGFSHAGAPAVKIATRVLSGVAGFVTIIVLAVLVLIEAPGMARAGLSTLSPARADRARRLVRDVGRSVSGYVVGNVATSLIAGIICGVALFVTHVPFAFVFAVWVGMVDLLPLVGGLLAGVPTVAFAFLHSTGAGITLLVVFLVYQQVENHVLNPVIMSRTVRLNPLWVILSVLAGAELAGFVGALLAIPTAGAIQVIVRDVWNQRSHEHQIVGSVRSDTPVDVRMSDQVEARAAAVDR